jgi:hypothetical protein
MEIIRWAIAQLSVRNLAARMYLVKMKMGKKGFEPGII